ncbi:MAG: hypothetical protein U0521_17175 [Anaerolineae bacterium]
MMAWIKVDSARWTDGQARVIVGFGNGGPATQGLPRHKSADPQITRLGCWFHMPCRWVSWRVLRYVITDWLHLLMTWSKANSYVQIYVNGTAGTQYSARLTLRGRLKQHARISVVDPNRSASATSSTWRCGINRLPAATTWLRLKAAVY